MILASVCLVLFSAKPAEFGKITTAIMLSKDIQLQGRRFQYQSKARMPLPISEWY